MVRVFFHLCQKNINVYRIYAVQAARLPRQRFIQVLPSSSVYTSAFKNGALLSSRLSTFVFEHIFFYLSRAI